MPLRLVILTRRYWPLVGGLELMLGNLAEALVRRGVEVTVVTARWQRQWPDRLSDRGVQVLREYDPPTNFWRRRRARRRIAAWLQEHAIRFDAILVSGLGLEATAALQSARLPVILQPDSTEPLTAGAVLSWRDSPSKHLVSQAAAGIAASDEARVALRSAGLAQERIHEIPMGVVIPPPRTDADRTQARLDLAAASSQFALPPETPLVIHAGPWSSASGVETLITAWREVAHQRPEARLWLFGDGPQRGPLLKRIGDLNLSGRVMLAGRFDLLDDFYRAADLFIEPAPSAPLTPTEVAALAAGLPLVAADTPGNRRTLEHGRQALLIDVQDPRAISAALLRLLFDRSLAAKLATEGRALAAGEFDLERVADRHLELLQLLLREPTR